MHAKVRKPMHLPLSRTACHSSLLFCTGYVILFDLLELEVPKREPKKGIVGIDLRTVARAEMDGAR